ncbi:Elongator subunit elp2 [Teratosphaeriaceae sp. CCFEE 6253]|nr:Elongator subunit elp2 [Teratosphaeriaceae sp. CCFEE 6253]
MSEDIVAVTSKFIAAGGNRHPAVADWANGILAFGAGRNIAIWSPDDHRQNGIDVLLAGHTENVNVVKIYDQRIMISGGSDKTIRIWKYTGDRLATYEQSRCLADHQGSLNTISVLRTAELFVSGAADGTVKIWSLVGTEAKLVQSISLKPRFLPLATALHSLQDDAIVLAIAGTTSFIQLFVRSSASAEFVWHATLTGHEGWIRSLDFVQDCDDVLLASASQDKYIRLWRVRKEQTAPSLAGDGVGSKKSLSNKAHQIGSAAARYDVSFEALLIGHEDWIYTAQWAPECSSRDSPTLLSASADSSLAIWTADEGSGVWVCNTRLGEISAQKGSTTATGSTGGFWIGLWHPDGSSVVSLGRTGSWRRWQYDAAKDSWEQRIGISGHTQEVQGLAWSPDGSYMLTTSSDQTTRLFGEWKHDDVHSWHELARPQIHGYDLNCIDALSNSQFISGADEKLLRVFNKPKAIAHLLSTLSGTQPTDDEELADAANIPVLGLSNKAVAAEADDEGVSGMADGDSAHGTSADTAPAIRSALDLDHPTLEDQLARQTLWPEHEKLYGHGYEISAVAASHDGKLVATACKASSLDHAVIRLYEIREWREVKPPLTAHTLTVTSLAFSNDDKYLLSVGRDRQWAVFRRMDASPLEYKTLASNAKAHTRMILDCAWAPTAAEGVFATAGRDKSVKIWKLAQDKSDLVSSIQASTTVTAVAFSPVVRNGVLRLALGLEDGSVQIVSLDLASQPTVHISLVPKALCPSGAVSRLRWRPTTREAGSPEELAVASEDGSVRILEVKREALG